MKKYICLLLLSFLAFDKPVQADGGGVRLYPSRIEMKPGERKAEMFITNLSSVEKRFRIEFVRRRMQEDGTFVEAEDVRAGELFADDYLRISPRRVTIAPKKSQEIRMLFRQKKGMKRGEYRTNLKVTQISDPTSEEAIDDGSIGLKIKANLAYSIPVFVTHGNNLSYKVNIENIGISGINPETNERHAEFTFLRSGELSAYGDVSLIHTAPSGEEVQLAFWGGLAVYTPMKKRTFSLPLRDLPTGIDFAKGKLKVIYRRKEKHGGNVIAEQEVVL